MSTVLVLRVCPPNMISTNNFQWPSIGPVECSDWSSEPVCGQGLHGWLWGVGDINVANGVPSTIGAKWLVVEVATTEVVNLDGKVKFPRGNVLFCGNRDLAVKLIQEKAPVGVLPMYGTATAGSRGTATAGDYGTATAGSRGTATAGSRGTATAGSGGTATAGYQGTAIAGDYGTATAGSGGTATAGSGGTATAGDYGTATAGARGTAIAGSGGTATAGENGTATAGYDGTAAAGENGILMIRYWDTRCRVAVAYVGENDIQPNVTYKIHIGSDFPVFVIA